MPTIEICAVGKAEPIALESPLFAVIAEGEIRSHRSLFSSDLANLSGAIYHFGNKACETRGFFFGSELLTEKRFGDAGILEFRPEIREAFRELMERLANDPETEYLIALTDYQFGPAEAARGKFESVALYWEAHDRGDLRINGMYRIG